MRVETTSNPPQDMPVTIEVVLANLARSRSTSVKLLELPCSACGVYVYLDKNNHFFLSAEKLALVAANSIANDYVSVEAALHSQVIPILSETPSWLLELAERLTWDKALLLADGLSGVASIHEFKNRYLLDAQFYLVGHDGLLCLSENNLN